MALQVGQNQNPAVLHFWALAEPQKNADRLKNQAIAWNALHKITFVAIAAICFSVLAVSFAVGGATGTLPFFLVALVFATPFLAIAASKCKSKSIDCSMRAEVDQRIADQLKIVKNWQDGEIRAYLEQNGVVPPANVSLRALLPLIARLEARKIEATEEKADSDKLLLAAEFVDDPIIRLSARKIGWQKLVHLAVPAALEAGFILHILSRPFQQLQLRQIGICEERTFEERQFDRIYGPDDHYFHFAREGRDALTLLELAADLSPQAMRAKLFDPVLPAPEAPVAAGV